MSVAHRISKNYMLPISAVVLALGLAGVVVGFGLLGLVSAELNAQVLGSLGAWSLWALFLGFILVLAGGWYFAEQLWNRRKFERLLGTDKRSDFVAARKELEDLAKRLPDSFKPRIAEKEATFAASRRRA